MAAARVVEINRRIKRDRVDNGSVRRWENAAKKFRFPFSGYIQTECDLLEPIIILKLVLILSYRWKKKKKKRTFLSLMQRYCDDLITFAVRCSIPWYDQKSSWYLNLISIIIIEEKYWMCAYFIKSWIKPCVNEVKLLLRLLIWSWLNDRR